MTGFSCLGCLEGKAIHQINHYPADSTICFVNTYPLDCLLDDVIQPSNNWGQKISELSRQSFPPTTLLAGADYVQVTDTSELHVMGMGFGKKKRTPKSF